MNEKIIPLDSPLIFAILPAMAINAIWHIKSRKRDA